MPATIQSPRRPVDGHLAEHVVVVGRLVARLPCHAGRCEVVVDDVGQLGHVARFVIVFRLDLARVVSFAVAGQSVRLRFAGVVERHFGAESSFRQFEPAFEFLAFGACLRVGRLDRT